MGQHQHTASRMATWHSKGSLGLILVSVLVLGISLSTTYVTADESVPADIVNRFKDLSQHGNSSCSVEFMDSIATMPAIARLKGSCCSPMTLHRYSEQIEGLKEYRDITIIPTDPYDIDAGLAQKLLASYDLPLSPGQQQAYDYAMQHSEEKGPCCCQCWRWHVFGGLAKLLIREHGFTGEQVTKVWNLSDGCGGDEHEHS